MPERSTTNPYPGARPFERGETLYGRDQELTQLFYQLSGERIVVLHSPSGAGKSSLVDAGLVPRLAERFDVWPSIRFSSPAPSVGNRFVRSAVLSLEEGLPERVRRPVEDIAGPTRTLAQYIRERPLRPGAPPSIVLFFDQFEEVLTLDPLDLVAKREFFGQLGEALKESYVWALFGLREEYLARLDPYRDDVPTRLGNTFRIDLLTVEAAKEAIRRPAEEAGRAFARDAAERLASDLAMVSVQQPDGSSEKVRGDRVEPLPLQVVCRRLWDELSPETQTIGVEHLQDVDAALAAYYESCVAGAFPTERRLREWFSERLVTRGGIRDQVLHEPDRSGGLDNHLIDGLIARYLVRSEQRAGATWYELAHDRLVEPVRDSNAAWFEQNLQPWQQQAKLWEQEDEPERLLLRGRALTDAQRWARGHPAALLPIESKLLASSVRRRRANRIKLGTLVLVTVLVAIAAGAFLWQYIDARHALQSESRALASEAIATRDKDSSTKLQLAIQAWNAWGTTQARGALRDALAAALRQPPPTNEPVFYAAFSPDGKLVATANNYGTVRIWDLATRSIVDTLTGHTASVTRAVFSPDSKLLVTASSDGTARIRDLASGQSLHVLAVENDRTPVRRAVSSPDGKLILTADKGGWARIWDASSGQIRQQHNAKTGPVDDAAFSPSGKLVAIAGGRGTTQIWDVASGRILHTLKTGTGPVNGVAFSPDGTRVATARGRVWDLARNRSPIVLKGDTRSVNGLAFSPDGTRIITTSDDGTARILDATTGRSLHTLSVPGQTAAVYRPVFSPDGKLVVSASDGDTVSIWEVATGESLHTLVGNAGPASKAGVNSAEFNPDGRLVVTAGADGTTRIWDVASGRSLQPLVVRILRPVYSPDGTLVVTAGEDDDARIWDVTSGQNTKILRGHDSNGHSNPVTSMAFSLRDTYVVTTSADGTAQVWKVGDGKSRVLLEPAWARFPGRRSSSIATATPRSSTIATATR